MLALVLIALFPPPGEFCLTGGEGTTRLLDEGEGLRLLDGGEADFFLEGVLTGAGDLLDVNDLELERLRKKAESAPAKILGIDFTQLYYS